jgi:hypothetical protein
MRPAESGPAQTGDAAGTFAQAVLVRDYPLEEEMLVIRALEHALSRAFAEPSGGLEPPTPSL